MNQENIIVKGKVVSVSSDNNFKVVLPSGNCIDAKPSGKIRSSFIRILVGDSVDVKLSINSLQRGIIVKKYKIEVSGA